MKRPHSVMMLFAILSLACTVKPGGTDAGKAADSTRAFHGQTVLDSTGSAQPHVAVRLVDGSRVLGRVTRRDIPFRTSYMDVKLEFKLLSSIEFSAGQPDVIANMDNGDRIKGMILFDALELETLVGTVTVPLGQVVSITVIHSTPGSTEGLVAFYPLHGNAEDQSGHNRHGALHGPTPTTDRRGTANGALLFDGSKTYVQIPDGLFSPSTAGFTLSAWVLTSNTMTRGTAIYIGTRMGESLLMVNQGNFLFDTKLFDGRWYAAQAHADQDKFVHLVCVYRRGVSIQIWVNGKQKGETAVPQLGLYPGPPPSSSSIGSYAPELLNHVWQGVIEDVRIYDRALSVEELHELYDGGQ